MDVLVKTVEWVFNEDLRQGCEECDRIRGNINWDGHSRCEYHGIWEKAIAKFRSEQLQKSK